MKKEATVHDLEHVNHGQMGMIVRGVVSVSGNSDRRYFAFRLCEGVEFIRIKGLIKKTISAIDDGLVFLPFEVVDDVMRFAEKASLKQCH